MSNTAHISVDLGIPVEQATCVGCRFNWHKRGITQTFIDDEYCFVSLCSSPIDFPDRVLRDADFDYYRPAWPRPAACIEAARLAEAQAKACAALLASVDATPWVHRLDDEDELWEAGANLQDTIKGVKP